MPCVRSRTVRGFAARNRLGYDVADALCLVVSELVTNAVLHARTEVVLTLELRPGVARVGVRDNSPATLAVRNYSPEAVTGRGLGSSRRSAAPGAWSPTATASW